MKHDRPSWTAQWVAGARALGAVLPDEAQLIDDPFGARILPRPIASLLGLARRERRVRPLLRMALRPLWSPIVYMQVRSRLIDDEIERFVDGGGRQLVVLGAGFDARALRLGERLGETRVFEVDHPATQRLKRERFGDGRVVFVAWDFERDPMAELPARLEALGHDRRRPTLTVWEGVTMYLTEPAIATTAAAVHAFSAPSSRLVVSYFDRAEFAHPSLIARMAAVMARRAGEPFRFGWHPPELPSWWQSHGFTIVADHEVRDAARRLLPPAYAQRLTMPNRHIAVATVNETTGDIHSK
jgi:methyltransferase (TIGR00027 family)